MRGFGITVGVDLLDFGAFFPDIGLPDPIFMRYPPGTLWCSFKLILLAALIECEKVIFCLNK